MIRFLHGSAALAEWMGEARQRIGRWRELSAGEEADAEQRRERYLQSTVSRR